MVNVSCLWVVGCGEGEAYARLSEEGTIVGGGTYIIWLCGVTAEKGTEREAAEGTAENADKSEQMEAEMDLRLRIGLRRGTADGHRYTLTKKKGRTAESAEVAE